MRNEKFTIIEYNKDRGNFRLLNNSTSSSIIADLTVDSSFPELGDLSKLEMGGFHEKMYSLVGKQIYIKELHPYEFIACDIKFITPQPTLK